MVIKTLEIHVGGGGGLMPWKSRWEGEGGSKKFGNPGGRKVEKCCHPWGGVDFF